MTIDRDPRRNQKKIQEEIVRTKEFNLAAAARSSITKDMKRSEE